MKVFIVTADDHDYDRMSQWVVGAFSTMALAETAVAEDEESYVKRGGERSSYNFEITEVELDVREVVE